MSLLTVVSQLMVLEIPGFYGFVVAVLAFVAEMYQINGSLSQSYIDLPCRFFNVWKWPVDNSIGVLHIFLLSDRLLKLYGVVVTRLAR